MSLAEENLDSSSVAEEVPCAGGFFDQELWYGPIFC